MNLFSAGLIAFSLVIGFGTLITILTRISFAILGSKVNKAVEEGKIIIPTMFNELKQVEAGDLSEFYQVKEVISIKQKTKIVVYNPCDIILRVPFTLILEEKGGVFLAQIEQFKGRNKVFITTKDSNKKDRSRKGREIKIKIFSVRRVQKEKFWKNTELE